jgi:hypothetical protein
MISLTPNSLSGKLSEQISCNYTNRTAHLQIARISNISDWYFERIVFPGQQLVFDAPRHAQLEIHTGQNANSPLPDVIACEELQQEVIAMENWVG